MLEKAKSFMEIDRKVADTQRSTLLLTSLISVVGVAVIAGLEAIGTIKEAEEESTTESD